MSDQNLNIHVKAIDEFTAPLNNFKGAIDKVSASVENTGRSLRSTGREIGFVGSAFTLLGVSITAPLTLAYNASAKYSAGITRQINDMKDQYENLQVQIGEALMPVMQQFNEILKSLIDRWNSLNPLQQQNIIQTIYMTGVWFTFGGIATKVLGEVIRTFGEILILLGKVGSAVGALVGWFKSLGNIVPIIAGISAPLWQIYVLCGLIIAIVSAIPGGWEDVLDTMNRVYDEAVAIFYEFKAGFETLHGNIKQAIADVGQANEAWKNAFKPLADGQHMDLTNTFKDAESAIHSAWNSLKNFGVTWQQISSLISGKSNATANPKTPVQQDFFGGFAKGVEDARHSLSDFFSAGVKAAQSWSQAMSTTFAGFFDDVWSGQLKKGVDYFNAFGTKILQIFDNVLSQMITQWIVSGIASLIGSVGSIGAGFGNLSGGTLKYGGALPSNTAPFKLPSFDVGTDYVPQDMIAMIHQGEKITPASQNNGGGGGVHITISPIIQLWDASDVQKNKKMLIDAVSQDILQNGTLRQIIKQNSR